MTTPRTRRAVPLAIAATFALAFAPALHAENHSEDGEMEMEDGGMEAEDEEMEEMEDEEMASEEEEDD